MLNYPMKFLEKRKECHGDCLNRWKAFKDNMIYQEFFKKETIELSNKILREIDGDLATRL